MGPNIHLDWHMAQQNYVIDITPEKLTASNVCTDLPPGIDILLPSPMLLPCSILRHYSNSHILDDLLMGVSMAIRYGLVSKQVALDQLESNVLIPFGMFAAKRDIKLEFLDRLWATAINFYRDHYIPRVGYQRRVIDFVFERITSMALIQLISQNKYCVASADFLRVSNDGSYKRTE